MCATQNILELQIIKLTNYVNTNQLMRRQLGSWCSKENFVLYTNCFPITLDMIDNTIPLVFRLQMLHDAETLFWYEENENTYYLNGALDEEN